MQFLNFVDWLSSRTLHDNLINRMESSTRIHFFVWTPHAGSHQINTDATNQVRTLDDFLQEHCLTYLHRGQILERSFTFQFYGIQSNDVLVAVLDGSIDCCRWLEVTADRDQFISKIQQLDNVHRGQSFRATDRLLARLETRPIVYRRMVKMMLEKQERLNTISFPSQVAVIPEPAATISDQPLPQIW
jgi:hypothetical protein